MRELIAIAERFPDVYLLGRHPSASRRTRSSTITAAELVARTPRIRRSWRSARRGSTITTTTAARGAGARLPRPYRGGARDRPAARHPHPRGRRGYARAFWKRKPGKGAFPAVLHCYTGGRELALRAIELGLSISFTGILTFKKSDGAARDRRRTAGRPHPGRDRLRPISRRGKFRGKRNEPAYVVETAKVLAETRGVSLDEIARQTTDEFLPAVHQGAAPRPTACSGMTMTLTILGCGSSAACRGRRWAGATAIRTIRRTAAAAARCWSSGRAAHGVTRIVIDTAPDLREQLSTPRSIGSTACF